MKIESDDARPMLSIKSWGFVLICVTAALLSPTAIAEIVNPDPRGHRIVTPAMIPEQVITFLGKKYQLTEVRIDSQGDANNLYIEIEHTAPQPAMFVVRHWEGSADISAMSAAWQHALDGKLLTKLQTFKMEEKEHAEDIFHVAWVGDPKHNGYFQAIFIRFTKENGVTGVKAYESSIPIDVHGEWGTRYASAMQSQFDGLKTLSLQIVRKTPEPAKP